MPDPMLQAFPTSTEPAGADSRARPSNRAARCNLGKGRANRAADRCRQ